MAAAAETMDMRLVEQTCDAFMIINNDYYSNLNRQDPRKPGDWWNQTSPAIINMYSAYLLNPELMIKCSQSAKYRQTQTSRAASLITFIQRFDIGDTAADAPRTLMSKSPAGQNLIKILEQQKAGIMESMRDHSGEEKMDIDDDLGGGRKRKQKGGALSDSSKRALANIIIAGAIVGAGITMFNMGGMKLLTSRLVGWLSPAFQDNAHCLSAFGYWKNKMVSSVGLTKSCSMIASENASAADWVVTKVQLALAAMGFSASVGVWGTWTTMQNVVIRFVIDPIDNGIDYFKTQPVAPTGQPAGQSMIERVISAEVGLAALKAYSTANADTRTRLLAAKTPAEGQARLELFFNKNIDQAIRDRNATLLGNDLEVVLPGQAAPQGATQLNDVYREVYFKSLQSAHDQATLAAAAAASSGAAATTGGKKKRKTLKKKHHKKHNKKHHKKHARKTGKKKMHKKKRRKTAKKHHKKHHKKRAHKTRKH